METLIDDIDAFLKEHGLSDRRFGELALNDKNFVPAVRDGARSPTLKTVERVRSFMLGFGHERDAA